MKKIMLYFVTFLLVVTLASCVNEEVEISIIVYADNPTEMVNNLEDLPELLASELQELGVTFNRVVVQSSNDISVIESSLENGTVDMAIMDPSMVVSTSLKVVLSVTMDESEHPDNPVDLTTYQNAIVVSNTQKGETFKELYDTTVTFTDMNGLIVCTVLEDEILLEEFVVSLGATTIEDVTINHSVDLMQNVFAGLENGSCDLGIVRLEEGKSFDDLWSENEKSVYEELIVLHSFTPMPYEAFYTIETANMTITNALVQAFIQISSHNSNQDVMNALGHNGYTIPKR